MLLCRPSPSYHSLGPRTYHQLVSPRGYVLLVCTAADERAQEVLQLAHSILACNLLEMPALFIDASRRGGGRGGIYRPSHAIPRGPYDGGYGGLEVGDGGEGDEVPAVEEGPVNRYAIVHEHQSSTTRQWEVVTPPSDSGDGPSCVHFHSRDDIGADDNDDGCRYVFTAKHRTYAHYPGHPPPEAYTAVDLHSEPLIQILRCVHLSRTRITPLTIQ